MRAVALACALLLLGLAGCKSMPKGEVYKEKPIPPGTVHATYYQLMGAHECTVGEWNTFLAEALRDSAPEFYKRMIPDTAVFYREWNASASDSYLYFRDKHFADYPIVGITLEQANAFCRWKSAKWAEDAKRIPERERFKTIVFGLPNREQWVAAANAGAPEKPYWWQTPTRLSEKRKYCASLENSPDDRKHIAHCLRTASGGRKSPFGLWNMNGNVAELLLTPGLAMGGSVDAPLRQCSNISTQQVDRPSATVGFRYMAVIVEE